ncbi:hypothetical protein KC363_g4737 [Hortaea werneckii]|uniref:HECT-type E3 ubiquitin transferase n=1 Tax=Hortaea werneckii TaxID=91943 RepID=A0A3M7FKG8_HORWE|nr:hypothetical protein KC363_g4737 [Hortaea werneckii]RMY89338.1 hypothetical protein D0861_04301 [Hortaea werneckii]
MYQSFTGSSRRPRQVNLSGRPTNPFASSTSPAGGPQSAIASAQQDRERRQRERERLHASNRIQKVWRGHSARRKTFRIWRQVWDQIEEEGSSTGKRDGGTGAYGSEEDALKQGRRLMLFYDPKEDARRLCWYGMRVMATASPQTPCAEGPWPKAYLNLSRACMAALGASTSKGDSNSDVNQTVLNISAYSIRRVQHLPREDAIKYYATLTSLETQAANESLQNALVAPLQSSAEAYSGLAILLSRPLAPQMLELLHSAVDNSLLCKALAELPPSQTTRARSRLWLLGNLVALAGGKGSTTRDTAYISAVSTLLGTLADDVEFEGQPVDMENLEFDSQVLSKVATGLPLNIWLNSTLRSLIDQNSIRNLLATGEQSSAANAQLLASYALTLLRSFPRRADDIRMWLYLGPTSQTSGSTPATQYFWNATKFNNTVFSTVHADSRKVLPLLKTSAPAASQRRDDWTVIMVFLELYTFLLKIMDDEEFMGKSDNRRSSAISTPEVAELVTFLKNLGFTLYFNASDLQDSSPTLSERDAGASSLGRHFGKPSSFAAPEPEAIAESEATKTPLTLAGLPGLTIDYLKGLVTGLLRAIYERDSRRHFLPQDHWLMTERFDMIAFIPGVVAEEESRHMVQDAEDGELDADDGESDDEDLVGGMSGRRGAASGYAAVLRNQNAREKAQRKASRKRYLESVAPRLEILQNMPFFIPFMTRVEIFRQFVHLDQEKRRNGYTDPDLWRQSLMFAPNQAGIPPRDLLARHHANIKRKSEFSDAFEQFYDLGADLKEPIQITFLDEWGTAEAGIDGGGVTKEFLTSVISQAFDPGNENIEHTYFVENDQHVLHPNPTALEDLKGKLRAMGLREQQPGFKAEVRSLLQQYEFLGRIIGKCLYEGILVDVSFAGFFLKKWALTGGSGAAPLESGYRPNINDLRELDEGLYKGLLALKNAPAEQVEDFGLTFTVDDLVADPSHTDGKKVVERELVPGGADMSVTAENRLIYLNAMARYRLQVQSAPQTSSFLKGLGAIVQPSWLSMFNQSELQTLIGGAQAEIDVADLRRHTQYGGVYAIGDDGQEHPSIQLFWQVMHALPDADRRKVVKFVTSTPRGPLLGFGQLNPRFSIRDSGSDENRYPTTSTCVNLLKLPMFKSAGKLRERLLAAVSSGAGFDLS